MSAWTPIGWTDYLSHSQLTFDEREGCGKADVDERRRGGRGETYLDNELEKLPHNPIARHTRALLAGSRMGQQLQAPPKPLIEKGERGKEKKGWGRGSRY